MQYREQIARTHGFETFASLLGASERLPLLRGHAVPSYLAKHPDGHWFVWEDRHICPQCKWPDPVLISFDEDETIYRCSNCQHQWREAKAG